VYLNWFPGLSLRSNPGLKLANAFGVFFRDARSRGLSTRRGFASKSSHSHWTLAWCVRGINWFPGLSLRFNPGLKLANAFGVFFRDARSRDLPTRRGFASKSSHSHWALARCVRGISKQLSHSDQNSARADERPAPVRGKKVVQHQDVSLLPREND